MIKASVLIAYFMAALSEKWGYIWGTAGVEWTAKRQEQKVSYMVSKYGANWKNSDEAKKDNYYSAAAYGSKWIGRKVADCSGLFYAAFKKYGGYIFHGSNTIWNSYCTSKGKLKNGKRTDGKTLRPGTAVFTYNEKKQNRGHIGLYIGNGEVIEASGTINGVIISKITASKWVEWGELKGVAFDEDETPVPTPAYSDDAKARVTLKRGNKGDAVKELQQLLIDKGYSVGASGVDGDFGKATENAVRSFQRDNGLTVDGVAGPETYNALLNNEPVKYYTVTLSHLTGSQADALLNKYPGAKTEERGNA